MQITFDTCLPSGYEKLEALSKVLPTSPLDSFIQFCSVKPLDVWQLLTFCSSQR